MNNLKKLFEKIFQTRLIFPRIFENFPIIAFFSQKLPYPFDFNSLLNLNQKRIFFPKQIHSTNILEITEFRNSLFEFKCDGTFTKLKNLFLGVRTADCLPILVYIKREKIIGAIHAGWKGSVNGILFKFLKNFLDQGIKSEEIFIAIGPHIKSCCYEVKDEVINKVKKYYPNWQNLILLKNNKVFLDLTQLNLFQALSLEIPENNIWISQDCTYCLNNLYWSHRFHKTQHGFQVALIGKV